MCCRSSSRRGMVGSSAPWARSVSADGALGPAPLGMGRRVASRTSPLASTAARVSTFSSSRTLPGQWYAVRRAIASWVMKRTPFGRSTLMRERRRRRAPGRRRASRGAGGGDLDHLEAIEEVLAKRPRANHRFEVTVRRREHARAGGRLPSSPTRSKLRSCTRARASPGARWGSPPLRRGTASRCQPARSDPACRPSRR